MFILYHFDVLVIGAGGAGCTAAITAARQGATVALVSKEAIAGGNTRMSGAEMTSSGVQEGDSAEVLKEDMIRGGEYLNAVELVDTMAKNASSAIRFVESLGHYFSRDEDGKLSGKVAKRFGGHSYHRSFFSPGSGMALSRALRNGVANTERIAVFEDSLLLHLLREEDEIKGALILNLKTNDYLVMEAGATVLATGGCGWLYYPQTTNNRSATGDGIGVAFEAGEEMVDMEMIQFFPFAINHPPHLAGSILDEPILAGPKGKLINGLGQVVADRDINRMTRAQVTALMAGEITAGRATTWGGLKLDLSGNLGVPEMLAYKKMNDERKSFEKVREAYGEAAFNWEEPWDVSPSAHYMLGGVKIDPKGRSSLKRLYAVGEVAGGMMGANRLGTTSIADIFVMGEVAGRDAADSSKDSETRPVRTSLIMREVEKVESLFGKRGKNRPVKLKRELQGVMRENVGIVRDEKRLDHALAEIERLGEELERNTSISPVRRYNSEVLDAVELRNMLRCAELIATGARMREESRGAHLRLDYPQKDDAHWLKNITLKKEGGRLKAWVTPSAAAGRRAGS